MRHRTIKAEHAYGLCRAPVVSLIGLAGSLGWVRLILDRFRDYACPHPDSSSHFIDLGAVVLNLGYFGSRAEVIVAFGADAADNQARERLVFAFVLIAFDVRRVLLPLLVS